MSCRAQGTAYGTALRALRRTSCVTMYVFRYGLRPVLRCTTSVAVRVRPLLRYVYVLRYGLRFALRTLRHGELAAGAL